MTEVYPITRIRSLMKNGQEDSSLQEARATECLTYPEGETAHQVAFLSFPLPSLNGDHQDGEPVFCLGVYLSGMTHWMRLHVRLGPSPNSTTLTSSVDYLFHTTGFETVGCCWGESGQRMLVATVYRTAIRVHCGIVPPVVNPRRHPTRDFEDNTAFQWYPIPEGERDLFAGFAFDEASGVCAMATCSGRIWIDDFSRSPRPADQSLGESLNVPQVNSTLINVTDFVTLEVSFRYLFILTLRGQSYILFPGRLT